MARIDLFELALSGETLQTLRLFRESGNEAFPAYATFCADILARSTELAYRSAISKVPVRSQSLRSHIKAQVGQEDKGYVYIEDGIHLRPEDAEKAIGSLRYGQHIPHTETGRTRPGSQQHRAVQHFDKKRQKTSRALKQSELAFLLDTGGYSLKKGRTSLEIHKQTKRNTSGLKLRNQLASHDLVAYVDANKGKLRPEEQRYRPDTTQTDQTDLQDIIKDYYFERKGVSISPLKPSSGQSSRKRQRNRKVKQVEDPRIGLVYQALTKQRPKLERRQKKLESKLAELKSNAPGPSEPSSHWKVFNAEVDDIEEAIQALKYGPVEGVFQLVQEATVRSYGRKLTKGKGFRRSIGTVIKGAEDDPYALEQLKLTVGNLPRVEKRVNALAAKYAASKSPDQTRKFEADKNKKIREYSSARKAAIEEIETLKAKDRSRKSSKGPTAERLETLQRQIGTYTEAINKAKSAVHSSQLPKDWVRSKDSIAADPFKGLHKGEHTRDWIASAQSDFQNHLKGDEDYRDIIASRPNERLQISVHSAFINSLSQSSLLGTQSIHSKKEQFNKKEMSERDIRNASKTEAQRKEEAHKRELRAEAHEAYVARTNAKIEAARLKRELASKIKFEQIRLQNLNPGKVITGNLSTGFTATTKKPSKSKTSKPPKYGPPTPPPVVRTNYAPKINNLRPQGPFSPYGK